MTPLASRVENRRAFLTRTNAFSFNDLLRNHAQNKTPGMSLFELLDYCAQHDFEAIDPTGYYFPGYPEVPPDAFINDFKRRAFQLGLEISGTGVRNDFALPDPAKRAADVKHAKAWIEVAAKLGAPVLRVFAGLVPKGYEDNWAEPAQWVVECLQECAEHGRKYGVVIGVQNHGDMLRNAEHTLHVLKRVASDWIGVIVDTGNMMTPDPYADIAQVAPHAVNWQIKESAHGNKSAVLTDLPKLIRIIKESGYRGYIPIETLVGTATAQGKAYEPYSRVIDFASAVRAAL
jgi:sugar phosphate isomerase/epimerase